jgi:hypothetical protein
MKIPILGKRSISFSELPITPNGTCFNCGKPLIGRQVKYCSPECSNEFWENHNWPSFRNKVIKARGNKCEDCGADGYTFILAVHHVHRIVDGGELCPDDPKAVVVVCRKCHGIRHRKPQEPNLTGRLAL